MAYQKRPNISNWLSSLLRQTKNTKEDTTLEGSILRDKQLTERSCLELSSTGVTCESRSIFYVTPLTSSTSSKDEEFLAENEKYGTKSSHTRVCASCFCKLLQFDSFGEEPPILAKSQSSYITPAAKRRFTSLKPATNGSTYNITPESPLLTLEAETSSEVIRNREALHLSYGEGIYIKQNKLTRITTTNTSRTLNISRPIEILLNEKGEIISKILSRNIRSNSTNYALKGNDKTSKDNNIRFIQNGNLSSVVSSPLMFDTGELRFIDESSNSQSESECTVVVHNNKINNILSIRQQNNNNFNHTIEETNLCDSCSTQLHQTRSNAEYSKDVVIMKHTYKQIKDELCEVVSEMEALDAPEDCKHSNKDKQMSIGRKKFNMDPKKGIEYLVENRLLRHDPQDVAHFLYKGEGLNKTAIGDYLGERNDFNEDVLKAFVALHDFTNLILVQALRQFLWSFRLPGEAQKIDRMMECFAQRYCQLNPDIFTNTDTCYVLSFAIIMLNTSLHNPSVKDKPSVEQFISMNRGINNGGDLPRGLLESLYESIRTEPFKIPQDDGNDLMHTFFNPDKEGWLWKQGGRYKSWKRRWFILNDNCLYYFEYTTDKEPRGIIPLENISVREIHDRSKPHCFELFATGGADIIKACKTDSEGKVVEGKHTVYRMSAATEEDQQEWIKRLTQSISHNPFYDILVQRKKKAISKS